VLTLIGGGALVQWLSRKDVRRLAVACFLKD